MEKKSIEKKTNDEGICKEIWKGDDFAEIREVKDLDKNNENGLRVYCNLFPNVFTVQIRTHKPIVDWAGNRSKAIKRNMIAHINLTIEDVEKILAYMKDEVNR